MITKEYIAEKFKELQDSICQQIEAIETTTFLEDPWEHKTGGGGRSRVIQKGTHIAKGGVNFSAVWGKTPEKILTALNLPEADYFATGVSIVQHPVSPMAPIIHMNVRYFEMSNGTFWFGGGIDLTPHYVNDEDARFFHHQLKNVCDKHDENYYPKFKNWADDYFYLPHRNETRGVGGIFFDHLNKDKSKEALFDFVLDVGNTFAPTYTKLLVKNHELPYGEPELHWQSIRRSRYVEFNLLFDKGTKFGIDTNGRTESILMSMPPMAQWEYNYTPIENTEEYTTLQKLIKGINWV